MPKTKRRQPIQSLEKQLHKRFSDADIVLDVPANNTGTWHLDITQDGHMVLIQWQREQGFGISCSPEHAYGERPDEIYKEEEAAYSRIVSLLLSKSYTAPPEAVRLRELRKLRGISQMELAGILAVQQGAVSKLERRHDMLLSTVRQVIRSMGGTLRLIAKFPDGMERSLEFEEEAVDEKAENEKTKLATS